MEPIDLLTQQEIETFKNYANLYLGVDMDYHDAYCYLYKHWSKPKEHLFHSMGDKLIVKTDFDDSHLDTHIKEEIDYMSYEDFYYNFENNEGKLDETLYMLYCEVSDCIGNTFNLNQAVPIVQQLNKLFNIYNIATNTLTEEVVFEIDHATLVLPAGMKTMRAVRKALDFIGMIGYEDVFYKWRDKISIVRTTSFKDAEDISLYLSIHPLDFITMSDNDYNWKTCYSWTEPGEFCDGVLEMLSSDKIILTYASCRKMKQYRLINDKFWRNYIVVDSDILIAGQGYPFRYSQFDVTTLEKARELFPHIKDDFSCIKSSIFENNNKMHTVIIKFKYGYNDFAEKDYPYYCIGEVRKDKSIPLVDTIYCLNCGKPMGVHEPSCLCKSCMDKYLCRHCYDTCLDKNIYTVPEVLVFSPQNVKLFALRVCSECLETQFYNCYVQGEPCVMSSRMKRDMIADGNDDIYGIVFTDEEFDYDAITEKYRGYDLDKEIRQVRRVVF